MRIFEIFRSVRTKTWFLWQTNHIPTPLLWVRLNGVAPNTPDMRKIQRFIKIIYKFTPQKLPSCTLPLRNIVTEHYTVIGRINPPPFCCWNPPSQAIYSYQFPIILPPNIATHGEHLEPEDVRLLSQCHLRQPVGWSKLTIGIMWEK